jgi:Domain of unknown function (DUF397)
MTGAHIPARELAEVAWRKSNRSASVANCVQVGTFDGGIVIRNSNDPDSGGLLFTLDEWKAFVGGAADGDFADLGD